MASRSTGGAYVLGALVGLVFSAGLAVGLSLLTPMTTEVALADDADPAPAVEAPAAGVETEAGEDEAEAVVAESAAPEAEAEPAESGEELAEAESAEAPAEPDAGVSEGEAEIAVAPLADPVDAVTPEAESAGEAITEEAAAVEPGDTVAAPEVVEAPEPAAPDVAEAEPVAPAPEEAPEAADVSPETGETEVAEAAESEAAEPEATEAESPAAEAEPAEEELALAAEPAADPAPLGANELPPFKANAQIYNGDRSQPLLAIVIVGDPADRDLMDDLLLMPGPLAIVVPPSVADPAAAAHDARDAGFEALIGIDAAGADAPDARLAGAVEAIGVALLGEEAGTSAVAGPVVELAAARGFAVFDAAADGGAAGFRAARAEGVPAASNGRSFDEIPSSAMIYQQLERAAFDARRTGAFVVMARAEASVLTGLRRWMNVKANKSVNVAPLSAVMEKIARQ